MSGTITGTKLAKDLLDGTINAAALETLLTTNASDYLGAWRALAKSGSVPALLNNTDAFAAVTGSDTALQYLIENPSVHNAILASSTGRTNLASTSEALATILNNSVYRAKFLANSSFRTAMEAAVNNGTYLYRETVTATGNYTPNAAGIAAMFVVAIGAGGTGGTATNSYGGQGGSGGEISGKHIAVANLPVAAVACTIPTVGSNTTFGALLTATTGANGTATNTARSGGGSTTAGGTASGLTSTNLDTAAWHYADFTKQGGNGGAGGTDPDLGGTQSGVIGVAGLTGSGGTAATGAGTAGGAGSGISSGGGGGYATDVGTGIRNGTAATASFGCGGGGGNSNDGDGSYGAGGAGTIGKIWVYTVRNRP